MIDRDTTAIETQLEEYLRQQATLLEHLLHLMDEAIALLEVI